MWMLGKRKNERAGEQGVCLQTEPIGTTSKTKAKIHNASSVLPLRPVVSALSDGVPVVHRESSHSSNLVISPYHSSASYDRRWHSKQSWHSYWQMQFPLCFLLLTSRESQQNSHHRSSLALRLCRRCCSAFSLSHFLHLSHLPWWRAFRLILRQISRSS